MENALGLAAAVGTRLAAPAAQTQDPSNDLHAPRCVTKGRPEKTGRGRGATAPIHTRIEGRRCDARRLRLGNAPLPEGKERPGGGAVGQRSRGVQCRGGSSIGYGTAFRAFSIFG